MSFIVYNIATGAIASIYSKIEGVAIPHGMDVLDADMPESFDAAYVSNGTVVSSMRPSDRYVFDMDSRQWVIDNSETAIAALTAAARNKRGQLLAASDWTQLPDVPLATKEAWATYRQGLRDITEQSGYPLDVVWPVAPG